MITAACITASAAAAMIEPALPSPSLLAGIEKSAVCALISQNVVAKHQAARAVTSLADLPTRRQPRDPGPAWQRPARSPLGGGPAVTP
ncbi:hypothetical protein PV682_34190 [Streptomyces niveiscabiei]|uniref:hypothetical protein n=1 Tax=Streptomyces niveiscabiei TaxID=164115 RepID=UPI0029B45D85|nr:hypothetical protein [Streptomyces niveiscabiei]MDX3386467.1 hypothetical protein [Streptomyces niveiscabiei]